MGKHRDDLFAGAALAQDQHGDIGARHQHGLRLDLAHPLAGAHKGVAALQPDLLRLARLFLVHQQVLGDGDLQRVVDEWLQHHAAGAQPGEDLVVGHLGGGRQDQHRDLGRLLRTLGEQRHGVRNPVPGQQHQAGPLHGLQVAQKGLFLGEEPQIVQRRKGPLQVVQDPDVRLEHEQAGPGAGDLPFAGEEELAAII